MNKINTNLVYGLHAVESAIRNQQENVLQVFIQKNRNDNRIQKIILLANNSGISVQQISTEKLKEKCPKVRHQGIIAQLKKSQSKKISLEQIIQQENVLLLVLDEVQDPHNIGACLRTADAIGVDAVIVSKNRSPSLTPVIRNVASGAAETIPYIEVSNLVRCIEMLKQENIWVLGTDGETKQSIYQPINHNRLALVMGSEGKGLRQLTRRSCDQLVSIPMLGQVESLNISVATAVCLFEIRRQQTKIK